MQPQRARRARPSRIERSRSENTLWDTSDAEARGATLANRRGTSTGGQPMSLSSRVTTCLIALVGRSHCTHCPR
jgi:hypothetical protein